MPSVEEFAKAMEWWCRYGDLGYDQANRWDLRVGGETDCSALIIGVLDKCGFDTGNATYTGNMAANLTAHGWEMLDPGVDKQRGDILLSHANHVACYLGGGLVAQASIDERGDISGGQSGDQADETSVHPYYDYPWDCVLRYVGGDTNAVSTYGGGSVFNPNGYGEDYVRQVQDLLLAKGYNLGADGADGVLGELTFNAIKSFQADHGGLTVDGIPGPQTVAALKGGSVTPQPAVQPAVDGYWGEQTTRMLQGVLGTTVDGVVSSQMASMRTHMEGCTTGWEWVLTASAQGSQVIEALQRALGVEADGLMGPDTINALSAHYGIEGDGCLDAPSMTIRAMQERLLNGGW